jgi:uncharacterized membrane protein YkvA (DUF1232 family)
MDNARGKKNPSALAVIKRLPRFLWRLVRDPRVPWTAKAALIGMAAYLAMPFDLIPDWIPGAGYLDDILVVAGVVNYVVAKVPRDVIVEHWGEDVEALDRLRRKRT